MVPLPSLRVLTRTGWLRGQTTGKLRSDAYREQREALTNAEVCRGGALALHAPPFSRRLSCLLR